MAVSRTPSYQSRIHLSSDVSTLRSLWRHGHLSGTCMARAVECKVLFVSYTASSAHTRESPRIKVRIASSMARKWKAGAALVQTAKSFVCHPAQCQVSIHLSS